MGTIHLVRHGQASFGSDDYDRLSALGWQQGRRLGEYFGAHGMRFDAVLTGTLRRHHETWQAIRDGGQIEGEAQVWPGLDEYDSAALIEALNAPPPATRTRRRATERTSVCCAMRYSNGWPG